MLLTVQRMDRQKHPLREWAMKKMKWTEGGRRKEEEEEEEEEEEKGEGEGKGKGKERDVKGWVRRRVGAGA